jgi:hypothetical protein
MWLGFGAGWGSPLAPARARDGGPLGRSAERAGPSSSEHAGASSSVTVSSPIATPAAGARGPRAWWLGLAPRQRRILRALGGLAVVLVLVVSAGLARFLSVENAERDDDLALIQAEARGDLAGMLAQLSGCRESRSCLAAARANAGDPRLRRAGAVKILQLESATAYAPFGASGKTRLAWAVIGTRPVVQCVDVRRSGNFLSGITVRLTGLSAPIDNEGQCGKPSQIEKEEEEATAVER